MKLDKKARISILLVFLILVASLVFFVLAENSSNNLTLPIEDNFSFNSTPENQNINLSLLFNEIISINETLEENLSSGVNTLSIINEAVPTASNYNYDGKVIDYKIEQELGKHIIIAEALDNAIGVMVDKVTEIIRVPRTSVKQAPEVVTKKISDHYLKGVIVIEDRLLIFLDLPNILSETELLELSQLAKAYQKPVKKKVEREMTDKEVKEKFERAEGAKSI